MSLNVWIKANLRDKSIEDRNLTVTQADGSCAGSAKETHNFLYLLDNDVSAERSLISSCWIQTSTYDAFKTAEPCDITEKIRIQRREL